ncbi:MAG: VOC family protein, partial [Actinobacteria bacterium]|nr:VOC family protein [Actinomycetota bacterium]
MEIDAYEHGVPSWVDVSTTNPAQVAEFFSALFGWTCPEGDPDLGGYRNCSMDGRRVAGVSELMSPDVPPSWTTYINVDDADAIA